MEAEKRVDSIPVCLNGLVSAAANIIIPRANGEQEVLMVKDCRHPSQWGLPGGGFEFGRDQDIIETIWRETREETGGVCIETGFEVGLLRLVGIFFLVQSPGVVFLFEGQPREGAKGFKGLRSDGIEVQKVRFTTPTELEAAGETMYPAQKKFYEWWQHWKLSGCSLILGPLTSPPPLKP